MIPIRSNWMNGYVIQKLDFFLKHGIRCGFFVLDKSVASFVPSTIAHKISSGYSRSTHPDVITKILFQILLNDIGYKACYALFFSLISYYIIYKCPEIFTSFLSGFHISQNIVALSTTPPTSLHQPLSPKSLRNSISVVVVGL